MMSKRVIWVATTVQGFMIDIEEGSDLSASRPGHLYTKAIDWIMYSKQPWLETWRYRTCACQGRPKDLSMDQTVDVVIIGGGVIGSSIAYFLSADCGFSGSIAVIERDPSYLASSSSLSTSAIRQQFGTSPNIAMSAYGIEFLRNVGTLLEVDGEPADIGLREPGYLILATPDQAPLLRQKHETQRALSVDVELLDRDAMGAHMPWINTEDLELGSYGRSGEGWFDGPGLLQAFKRKARCRSVKYIAAGVTGLERAGPHQLGAVRLDNGDRLSAGTIVLAAGPWSGEVARMAGLHLPVAPRKRCVFVIDAPLKIPNAPFHFDTTGLWFRPEGRFYICGRAPAVENADDDFGLNVDHDLFEEEIWPVLAHRVPAFEQLKVLRAWAGLYEYNTFDHSALIGRHPEFPNLVIATGFSGHGMMHAPATGAGVRDLIAYGEYREIDLTSFHLERVAANQPIEEQVY
jgi:FAD-dependent oxidoreductase domain-containing protein 1